MLDWQRLSSEAGPRQTGCCRWVAAKVSWILAPRRKDRLQDSTVVLACDPGAPGAWGSATSSCPEPCLFTIFTLDSSKQVPGARSKRVKNTTQCLPHLRQRPSSFRVPRARLPPAYFPQLC